MNDPFDFEADARPECWRLRRLGKAQVESYVAFSPDFYLRMEELKRAGFRPLPMPLRPFVKEGVTYRITDIHVDYRGGLEPTPPRMMENPPVKL